MNKLSRRLTKLLCSTGAFLLPATVIAAGYSGTLILKLSGEVDLAKTPDISTPTYLSGSISGQTSMTLMPAYSTQDTQWSSAFAMVGLSGNPSTCSGGTGIFQTIPGTNQTGVQLEHSSRPGVSAYLVPAFRYNGIMTVNNTGGWTVSGQFFSKPYGGSEPSASHNKLYTCIYPDMLPVKKTWYKQILIYDSPTYPIYLSRPLAPGKLNYKGTMYITTEGMAPEARGYLAVNISADMDIKATCQISNVINNNIDATMGYQNEVIKESSLTFSCSGEGQQQVYLSAKVTEGTADTANPNRLLLTNITSPSVTNRPWVIGKPFLDDASPSLTCKDANADGLIKFNNQAVPLPLKANINQLYRLGIKWAICSDDSVPAGNYRGKTVINIYTKM